MDETRGFINCTNNEGFPSIKCLFEHDFESKAYEKVPKNLTVVLGLTGSPKNEIIKIVSSTEQSNTYTTSTNLLCPGLIIDSKQNTAFYVYPGFDGNISFEEKVTANYLLSKLVYYADSMKLILTVSDTELESHLSDQINLLIKSVVKIFKNPEILKENVALVITQDVKSTYDEQDLVHLKQNLIIGVANNLENSANNYSKTKNSHEEEQELIKSILRIENGIYTNIGIYQTSEKLSEKELGNKKHLDVVINKNTNFTDHGKDGNSFFITAPDYSNISSMNEVKTTIQSGISKIIKEIGANILKYYDSLENRLKNIEELHRQIGVGINSLKELRDAHFDSTKDFLTHFLNIKDIHIIISEKINLSIINYIDYLNYVEMSKPLWDSSNISRIDSESFRANFVIAVNSIIQTLENSQSWYTFLMNLHTSLSSYSVQERYEDIKENIKQLIHEELSWNGKTLLGDYNDDQRDLVSSKYMNSKQNVSKYVEEIIAKTNLKNVKEIRHSLTEANVSHIKLKFLSKMLHSLFYSLDKTEVTCLEGILTIQGQFIKFSDISKIEKETCDKSIPITAIELLASNTVFVDNNLNKTGNAINLSVITPTLEVIGNPQIIVDGEAGEVQKEKTAPAAFDIPGANGNDGKPGKAGGPSGNILIIASNFINDEYLTISAVGGRGGPGQDGSDGVVGKSTEINLHKSDDRLANHYASCEELPSKYQTSYYKCQEAAEPCGDGGKGGKGGSGGMAGKKGNVKVLKLGEDLKLKIINHDGEIGIRGNHGEDQLGGTSRILKFDYSLTQVTFRFSIIYEPNISNQSITVVKCNPGLSDKNVVNYVDIEVSKPCEMKEPADILNHYKTYVRSIYPLDDRIRDESLKQFLFEIENRLGFPKDVMTLINEFTSLENQFFKLQKQISFLSSYESLFDRITKHAEWFYQNREDLKNKYAAKKALMDTNINEEQSKLIAETWFNDRQYVLKYLYTATLSKISSLRDEKSGNLIVNVKQELDSAIENINLLKDYNKVLLVENAEQSYQTSMNKKIEEALRFIPKIKETMENLLRNVDDEIRKLIEEVKSLENKVEGKKTVLLESQRKLQNAIMVRSLLVLPNLASRIVTLAGPLGLVASVAIRETSLLVESLGISQVDGENLKVQGLPIIIDKLMPSVMESTDKEEILKKQLSIIEEEFKVTDTLPSVPKSVINLKNKISKFKEDVSKNKGSKDVSIEEKLNGIKSLMEKELSSLKDYKGYPNLEFWVEKLRRVHRYLGLVIMPLKIYNDIEKDTDKIELVARNIEQSNLQLKKLDNYKTEIYKNIVPQCRALQKRLFNLCRNATMNKSHAALDIGKWQMQRLLRDVKNEINKLTKEFEVQEEIALFLAELDYALSTMINIYNRIEDYRDKKELADYVRNINLGNDVDTQIVTDFDLKRALSALKLSIHSNLVLKEYEKSVYAVKQMVYPLADKFLEKYQLPINTNDAGDVVALANAAANQLIGIRNKLIKSNIESQLEDRYWFPDDSEFNVSDEHRNAFYTWKYVENKHAISQFLKGKEVTLKSDITKGSMFSAVKFRVIGMNFVFGNKTLEEEFKKELKHYDLVMVHLGNSQYKCKDKFHVIANDELHLKIEFATSKGNKVFAKLKDNEAALSPYASWNMSLVSLGNRGFDSLAKYENVQMDLALEGKGSYLETHDDAATASICNDDLLKYYKKDETVSGITTEKMFQNSLDEIPEIGKSNAKSSINHERERRSLKNDWFSEQATSGASSTAKSSFLNNIFNLLATGFAASKYLIPVHKLKQWFAQEDANVEWHNCNVNDGRVTGDIQMINIAAIDTQELPKVSKIHTDKEESTVHNLLSDSSFCNVGNLLLLDLLIRSKSGVKYRHGGLVGKNVHNSQYAQNLAYREHIVK